MRRRTGFLPFLLLVKHEPLVAAAFGYYNQFNSANTVSRTRLFSDPSSLLYEEHEKLLVRRGELEADLMKDSHQPLLANIVKGGGGGGGFGGGAGGSKKSLLKTQAQSHAKVLRDQGVVRIDNVLPKELATEIRSIVYKMRAESEQLFQEGKLKNRLERFADVLLKENRCDMTIPIGPEWVAKALHSILVQSSVGITMQKLLGKDAVLYELSCLMSDPNSQRQVVHPDTPCSSTDEDPVLYTCFVALQDITIDMGPTTWIPKTHTLEMHQKFQESDSTKDQLLSTQPSVLGLLPQGSCAIFDSRVLHCGGANSSFEKKSRALFYFSFQNSKIVNVGNPGSIRPNLIGKWRLNDLEKELERFHKGKPTDRLITDDYN